MSPGGVAVGIVEELWRYPVKSMLGERLDAVVIGPAGVLGDRAYAVVDAADGTVATAKRPRYTTLFDFRARFTAEPEPGAPLPPADVLFPDGSTLRTDDDRIHAALSGVLGHEVRLSDDPNDGHADEEHADEEHADDEATFFDLAPLHVLTTATLAALTDLAPTAEFDVRRYRPNLLVRVPDATFVEDAWVGRTLTAGEVAIEVSMPTPRCVMTTLAQEELPEDPTTLRTPAKHHRLDVPGEGVSACAGVYGAAATSGRVTVGDPVTLAP